MINLVEIIFIKIH